MSRQSGHLPWTQTDISQRTVVSISLVQRGSIAFTTETSKTASITSIDTAKSELHNLGTEGTSVDTVSVRLTLTNTSTITATRQGTGGSSTVGYQVITRY